ncbi:MAG: hypothetical protein FRX49_01850 [Trebouxia sp. A1-2]|nr:MAG: hypothetical protein FRX49_01850 [Trebouxia sp. A1-2]
MAGTAAPGLPLLLAPVTTWTPSWGHTMTSATLRLPATTIIITSVQMYRKDRTTKHKSLVNRGAPGGRWLVTPLKPDAGGQGLPDDATGSMGMLCSDVCSQQQQLKGCGSRAMLDLLVPASASLTKVFGAGASSTLRLAILEGELQAKEDHQKDASMAFQVELSELTAIFRLCECLTLG